MKKYYFKEKFFKVTDHYPIHDEFDRECFYVDEDFARIGYKVKLYDKNKEEIFSINKNLSFRPVFKINFSHGKAMTFKGSLNPFIINASFEFSGQTYMVKGNLISHHFDISRDRGLVGEINKKIISLTDCFELTVYDENLTYPLIASCLCLNNIIDSKKESS